MDSLIGYSCDGVERIQAWNLCSFNLLISVLVNSQPKETIVGFYEFLWFWLMMLV